VRAASVPRRWGDAHDLRLEARRFLLIIKALSLEERPIFVDGTRNANSQNPLTTGANKSFGVEAWRLAPGQAALTRWGRMTQPRGGRDRT
jgi:hypothetical protein